MEAAAVNVAERILSISALILIIGSFSGKLSGIIKIPDVILFIVAGVILGPQVLNILNFEAVPYGSQLILIFGSAYILYDGGREIKLKVLRKVKMTVGLLSTLGVVISALGTGAIAYIVFKIPFIYCALMGAVIASTDPAVLVPLFKKMNVNERLKQTIISESAFNDAAGAIVTFAVLAAINGRGFSLVDSGLGLIKMALGGAVIGIILGLLSTSLVGHKKYGILSDYTSIVAIVTVILAYVIGDKLGFSGFMAVFIVGIICGNKGILNLHIPDECYETHMKFKEVVTLILRMLIFILLGTFIDFSTLALYWKQALVVVLTLIFIIRPISVFVSASPDKRANWSIKEILFISWVRETGVIPAALCGMLISQGLLYSEIISAVTFMTILVTVSIQAPTTTLLAKYLKLEDTVN